MNWNDQLNGFPSKASVERRWAQQIRTSRNTNRRLVTISDRPILAKGYSNRYTQGYEIPTGNANYVRILHIVSKLSENGVAILILANGSMSTNTKGEGKTLFIDAGKIERNSTDTRDTVTP